MDVRDFLIFKFSKFFEWNLNCHQLVTHALLILLSTTFPIHAEKKYFAGNNPVSNLSSELFNDPQIKTKWADTPNGKK